MRYMDIFLDDTHDTAWLRRLLRELEDGAHQPSWTVEDKVLSCRPADAPYPRALVRSDGQVDVVAYEGDDSHPGLVMETAQVHPRKAARLLIQVLTSHAGATRHA